MSSTAVAPVPRVGIRRDQVVVLGRYVSVFRPVMDSILDTIFWGDGYKSIAHIVMLSYLTYHNLCGIRFMFLFTMFHFFMKAGKRGECTDEEAIFQFKMAVQDLTIVMRRYNPTLSHIWPLLLIMALFGGFVEVVLHQSIVTWVDDSIGPLSVLVILMCYGLVDPRHTRTYMTPAGHSRTGSQQAAPVNSSIAKPPRASPSVDTPRGSEGVAANTERASVAPGVTVPASISPLTLAPKSDPFSPLEPQSTRSSESLHRYSAEDTPTAPWDELMPSCPTLPTFVHKNLMLYTRAPAWKDWKVTTDIVARDHPISWTIVKAGLNILTLRDVSFDEAVAYINDDPDFRTPVENLSVFQFDKLLGEFRRLAIVDEHTRVVHMIYKQIIFGIAPRDAPMYQFAKELTSEEIDYYGLCREHANNKNVTDGRGRVFVLSSAPADGVPPVKGHVRVVVHRQAILIREILSTNSIEVMTLMCGEPGGNVPKRIVEMSRGEQVKVLVAMRKALGPFVAKVRKSK